MIYKSQPITLKNGKCAIFRSPEISDAEAMVIYLKTVSGETDFLVRTPEECNMTTEAEAKFIAKLNESSTNLMIVCTVDGEMAGNCSLQLNKRIKTEHRASLGIALYKNYWNLGIGSAMLDELSRIAAENGVKQLELQVKEGNTRAIALYEKKGFTAVASLPDAYKMSDGSFCAQITMIKKL